MKRIVSLLPSATELCCSLGLRDQLVAISHECDFPADLKGLPAITSSIIPHGLEQREIDVFVRDALAKGKSLYAVDQQLLRELRPDLILTQGLCSVCAVSEETIQATLRGTECMLPATTTVLSFSGGSFEGICTDLRTLSVHTETQERAEQIIDAEKKQWDSIVKSTAQSVLLLEWIDPFFSAGHWVPEQIAASGFVSAIGRSGERSRTLSVEEVGNSGAEVIGVICCGFSLSKNIDFAERLYQNPQLATLPAIKNQQVWAFDANSYFSRPTLRIRRGAQLLQAAFMSGVESENESKSELKCESE